MKEKNIKYKPWTVRLSEKNKDWLKEEEKYFESWNLFFDRLKKIYEKHKTDTSV